MKNGEIGAVGKPDTRLSAPVGSSLGQSPSPHGRPSPPSSALAFRGQESLERNQGKESDTVPRVSLQAEVAPPALSPTAIWVWSRAGGRLPLLGPKAAPLPRVDLGIDTGRCQPLLRSDIGRITPFLFDLSIRLAQPTGLRCPITSRAGGTTGWAAPGRSPDHSPNRPRRKCRPRNGGGRNPGIAPRWAVQRMPPRRDRKA